MPQSNGGGVDGDRRGYEAGALVPLNTPHNCRAMAADPAVASTTAIGDSARAVQAESSAAETAPSIAAVDTAVAGQALRFTRTNKEFS